MIKILKSIAVAFSLYSRIPMPKFTWASDDMRYHLIFFPFIGMIIAVAEYILEIIYLNFGINVNAFAALSLCIPILITGGFHIDGYMDTSDALSSFQDKEKRLEILKDPHIGAFSVIQLVLLGLLLFAAIIIMPPTVFHIWLFSFFISRALSGICVVKMKNAKNTGLMNTESETADKNIVFIFLILELVFAAIIALLINPIYTLVLILSEFIAFLYYRHIAYSKFGGITGDLAGYSVCISELTSALFLAAVSLIF
ncbi:MAG: adenosylcobinamide-GDP ribazoletransferase [Butyrivibrio sp.]|nr:adenosylcobinamide-GDP ribazoletransferase [Butyrivibrio sp.]